MLLVAGEGHNRCGGIVPRLVVIVGNGMRNICPTLLTMFVIWGNRDE